MKKLLVLVATVAALVSTNAGVASAGGQSATTTQYTASYTCGCFGQWNLQGVHVTNRQFPGVDNGNGDATGGRDNFSGTVSNPPSVETVWSGSTDGQWFSDYSGQPTTTWKVTFRPDGSLTGYAIYPAS
ncbi:MAG: hypothetical protein ABR520_07160 [Mycobacteriales bacterium]|nr:hypothetical protein [Frankia sp.]